MEETDLLKEITYLTRLIDKHKKVPEKTPSTNTSTKVAKERGHPVLPVQQFHVPKDKKMNCMIQTKNASNTTQMTKFTSPSLCKTAVSESKVIFINPARLKMSGVNKPLTSRRIVVPQNTVVNKNTSTRTVFINPNFKHMVGRGMSEKPFNALSSSKTSQSCVGLNNSVNSVNSNLNFKQSVGKKLDKSLEKSMSFECFKLENRLNKPTLINKSCTTKAMSCYINPHFKGILSHKDNQCKQDSFKQNKNLKEEAKQTQAPQRIVMLGTGTTSTESFFKSRTNLPLSPVLQTPQKDHDSISKPFLNQEFSDKAVAKLQQLRKNKQLKNDLLNLPKIIINLSPSQPKGKVMCINVSTKAENNLVPKKVTSSQIDKESPGPRKIYVNKEKWKSNLAKFNKTSGGPSIISDCLIKSESTKTNMKILNSARNIYVNRSLLAKQLKENQLRNSISAMNMKTTQDCILKLPDSSKRMMQQIKSNIIRQRKRSSSSTCLVSVSKTKLVRKNKSIVQVGPLKPNKRYAPENLNKLRKLEIAKQFRYRPVKRAISRYHTQYINSNEISKLRKCSFVWSINNLVNINMHQQKTKLINPNKGIQSRFKYKVVSKEKIELKKSKYHINRIKDNKQSIMKNRQVIKKSLQQKPEERICKGSRKLVRNNSSILMLSPTKLVRRKLPVMRSTPVPSHKLLPSVQMARLVKSKYKLNRSVFALKKNSFRYNRLENSGNSMQNSQLTNSRPYITKISSQKNRFPSLVNIGGVFYKVTHNKLTRRSADSNKVVSKGPILQVRGQRFRLDKTGRTLKSLGGNALTGVNKLRRVDIGGVTFIRSKQGTSLVRTNTHTARNRLIQAKQRSISLLTKKLRKNNQPCPLFHRFGRCTGKEKGTCSRTHNPKNIAICKKFVQGQCENTNCLLSHAIGPEKMPTCYHYLAGNCVRDNCPYLHVKVNSKAPVCLAFLQGYCGDGEKCKKRHKNVCPEFEDKGTCAKGKYCPYPHPKQNTTSKSKPVKRKKVEMKVPVVEISKEVSTFRYFDEEQHHEGLEVSVPEKAVKDIQELIEIDESEEISESVGKRPKLGVLPAFIPLSMD